LAFILDITFPTPQSVPSYLVKCRSKAVKLIHLYQFKFNEYFQNYSADFFSKIWAMIVNGQVPASKTNEGLLNSIIKYLTEITFNTGSHDFFKANMI
jgi:Cse1